MLTIHVDLLISKSSSVGLASRTPSANPLQRLLPALLLFVNLEGRMSMSSEVVQNSKIQLPAYFKSDDQVDESHGHTGKQKIWKDFQTPR